MAAVYVDNSIFVAERLEKENYEEEVLEGGIMHLLSIPPQFNRFTLNLSAVEGIPGY